MSKDDPFDLSHISKSEIKRRCGIVNDMVFAIRAPRQTLYRKHYVFILIATLIYLIFEFAFSAKLLDVVSQSSSEAQIDQVERIGRLLSGIALTLVVWGSYTLPALVAQRATKPKMFKKMSIVAVACCLFSYAAQEIILRSIVATSSGDARKEAIGLQLIAHSLEDGDEIFNGHIYNGGDTNDPAAMSFRSLIPVIGLLSDLPIAPEAKIVDMFTQPTKDELGDASTLYRGAYLPAMDDGLSALYQGYRDIGAGYKNGVDEYERIRRQLWKDHGAYFISVSRRAHPGPTGGPNEAEMKEFESVYLRGERDKIERRYRNEMNENFGGPIVAGLSREVFATEPRIQEKIRSEMGIKNASVAILPGLSEAQFKQDVYQRLLDDGINDAAHEYLGRPQDYKAGGRLAREGARAIKGSYVTLIALSLSLLGSIVHVWKVIRFAIKVVNTGQSRHTLPIRKAMLFANLSVFLVLVFFLATVESELTSSLVFKIAMARIADISTYVPAVLIESVINAETTLYPIAKNILVNLPRL